MGLVNQQILEHAEKADIRETLKKTAEYCLKENILPIEDDFAEGYIAGAIFGAKWQQERSYNEEEVLNLLYRLTEYIGVEEQKTILSVDPKDWFEQFNKK